MSEVPSQGELRQLHLARRALPLVRSIEELIAWCSSLVPLGVASRDDAPISVRALNDEDDEQLHGPSAADGIAAWEPMMAVVLSRLQRQGEIDAQADIDTLATAIVATVGGGYLLARTARGEEPLRVAVDLVLALLARHAADRSAAGCQR